MEDTSFAIHPGHQKKSYQNRYQDIGNIIHFSKQNDVFNIETEHGYVTVMFYRNDIVRVVMNSTNHPELDESYVVEVDPERIDVGVDENKEYITLTTSELIVELKRTPLRLTVKKKNGDIIVSESHSGMAYNHDGHVICYKDADAMDHYYGFGEKTGFLDKRGEKFTMWNTDVYAPHNPETDPLYQSIPFFMTLRNGQASGLFFDNTFKSVFDMRVDTAPTYSFMAEGGQLDYYVCAGPTPKKVLEQYTYLTGKMPLPPKWGLGYHQSRYSYETEKEVRSLVDKFIEREIPVDAIHLDIHYMDGYRVFTFDYDRFPNPKKLISDLKEKGIRAIPIVDPGVKVDVEYPIYYEGVTENQFCKSVEGEIYYGDVWPGKSAFPDFTKSETRQWWGDKHKFYVDQGIEGIWNDMNEPAVFNETKTMDLDVIHENDGQPKTHRELHNVYGYLMGQATYEGMKKLLGDQRPFLLTRAGYAGVQKYAAVWTGDNRSFWEHLEMAIPMCLNLGVSGVAYSGPDVGGFAHDTNGELLTRWTQFGAFTPFFRNHCAIEFVNQEPWQFGESYEKIIKKYIQLRYKWMPYLYQLFKEASETGTPVMRPLFLGYPSDEETYAISDQFLVGENLLVAPIIRPGMKDRIVYLPEGTWYDYWTDEPFEGGKRIMVHAELDQLPMFIKKGSIIPQANIKASTAIPVDQMSLHLYPSEDLSTYVLYDDDGQSFGYEKGEWYELKISTIKKNDKVEINTELIHDGYQPQWSDLQFHIHGVSSDVELVYNGEKIERLIEQHGCITFTSN